MIPASQDTSDAILPLSLCRLTPQGVASVVHYLVQNPTFSSLPEEQLRAMAFAFLAHGGTNDNDHAVSPGSFHRIHYEAHNNSGCGTWPNNMCESYLGLVMDLLTWLDRISGGSSLLMHNSGIRPPGTWAVVEEAKVETYLPHVVMREQPALRAILAQLVQCFAQYVATPTMERWDRARSVYLGVPLHNPNAVRVVSNRGVTQPLIPESSTPRHTFYGRRVGVVDLLIAAEGLAQLPHSTSPLPGPHSPVPPPPSPVQPMPSPAQPIPFSFSTVSPPVLSGPSPVSTMYATPSPVTPSPSVNLQSFASREPTLANQSGKPPPNIHCAEGGPWTEEDSVVHANVAVSEIAPSDSVSRQLETPARKETTRFALGTNDLVSDLLYRIQDKDAEIRRLLGRVDRENTSGDESGGAPQAPPIDQSGRIEERSYSGIDPGLRRRGKTRDQTSSSQACMRPNSLAPSLTTTVCDAPNISCNPDSEIPPPPSASTEEESLSSPSSVSHCTPGQPSVVNSAGGPESTVSLRLTPSLAIATQGSGSSVSSHGIARSIDVAPPVIPFGPATEHAVAYYTLSPQVHEVLRRVAHVYTRNQWSIGVSMHLPDVNGLVANELLVAMREDRPLA